MKYIIHFNGQCIVRAETLEEAEKETYYALYHEGLIDDSNIIGSDITCGVMDDTKIIATTRREADLIGNGILALINNANEAQKLLGGNCSEEIESYLSELRTLLSKIGSLEKEE